MPLSDAQTSGTATTENSRMSWVKDYLIIGLIALVWICCFFAFRPLTNPDEGRYAEIPREMALSGNFVTPRLDGLKYFEKPPLLYWLSAFTFRAFGVNEFTARIWNGLFAVGGVLLVYWAGRTLYSRAAGIWAAIILGTCTFYYALGQILTLDMAVAVTISGALLTFLVAVELPAGRKRFWLMMACYVFMALATLTKGLIGFLLPGAVMFLWLLLLKQWRRLLPLHLVVGIVLFLAIAAPWHILADRANPSFSWFYFVHEHFLRFTTKIHRRYEPWYFLIPFLVVGMFPWVFFTWQSFSQALKGGWKAREENRVAWFLAIWIAFIYVFFSTSQSKLPPYILPVFPAIAVLMAPYFARIWQKRSLLAFRKPAMFLAGFAGILAITLIFVKGPKGHEEFKPHMLLLKAVMVTGLTAGTALTVTGILKERARMILSGVAATGIALLVGLNVIGIFFDSGSTKNLAKTIQAQPGEIEQVYCLSHYSQDLPVYLQRLVSVVSYQGELEFGISDEKEVAAPRFISTADFLIEWKKPGNRYAVLRQTDSARIFPSDTDYRQIGQNGRMIVVTNRPAEPTP